jgi:two-component system chemotaxis sensor kinase CheA
LRNAVDHGIETPEGRAAAGKSERGHIVVRAYHDGTDVVIEVEDDGRGLDVERIRRTAIDRGLVGAAEAAALAPEALYLFVFEPGFSTAKAISEISGRGVGMDVVKSKVSRAGGRIRIDSRPGEGTRMSVRVPMTLAITRVLLVRAGGETFGLPLGAVAADRAAAPDRDRPRRPRARARSTDGPIRCATSPTRSACRAHRTGRRRDRC